MCPFIQGPPPLMGPSNSPYHPGYNPSYPAAPPPAYPAYPSAPAPPYPAYPVAPAPGGFPHSGQFPAGVHPAAPGICAPPRVMPYTHPGPYPVAPGGYPGVPPPGVYPGPYPHAPKWGHHKYHHKGYHHGGVPAMHGGLTGGLVAVGMGLVGHKANKKLRKKMKKAHKANKHWHYKGGKVGLEKMAGHARVLKWHLGSFR